MPVADLAKHFAMLDRARKGKFAYPAINVTSLTTPTRSSQKTSQLRGLYGATRTVNPGLTESSLAGHFP
jgi:hypothetical protein